MSDDITSRPWWAKSPALRASSPLMDLFMKALRDGAERPALVDAELWELAHEVYTSGKVSDEDLAAMLSEALAAKQLFANKH
jgi:hypothetical protein